MSTPADLKAVCDLISQRTQLLLDTFQGSVPVLVGDTGGIGNSSNQQIVYNRDNLLSSSPNMRYDDTTIFFNSATGPVGPSGAKIQVGSIILPDTTETHDLGTSNLRFRDLYLSPSSLYLGNTRLFSENGRIGIQAAADAPRQSLGPVQTENFCVAGGSAGGGTPSDILAYSYDGIIWTSAETSVFGGSASANCYSVAWGGNLWVAVGDDGTTGIIAISSDGINWTAASQTVFGAGAGIYGVAWNGTYWLAVGQSSAPNGTIATSTNGKSWSAVSLTNFNNGQINGVATNGTMWVTVGDNAVNGIIATSIDGTTWTTVGSLPSVLSATVYCIAWNGTMWIAGGTDGTVGGLCYSYNGTTWTAVTISGSNPFDSSTGVRSIAWNGSYWLAVGKGDPDAGVAATSSDGITWTATTGSPFPSNPDANANGVTWNGTFWIATGFAGGGGSAPCLSYSSDGNTWTSADATLNMFDGVFGSVVASRRILPFLPQKIGPNRLFRISSGSNLPISNETDRNIYIVSGSGTLNLTFTNPPPAGWYIVVKNRLSASAALTITRNGGGTVFNLANGETGFISYDGTNLYLDDDAF